MPLLEITLLAVLLAMPLYTAITHKRNVQALVDGEIEKTTSYQRTMCFLWTPTLLLFAVIYYTPLTAADLGLSLPLSIGTLLAGLIALILILLAAWNLSVLNNNAEQRARYQSEFEPLRWLLPETKVEYRWFVYGVSPSAGICEELIFRGYLLWLLEPWLGIVGAILASSLLFGLNHIYQGWAGVLKTGVIGVILAIVYCLTESLWIAILLHLFIDVFAGLQSYLVLKPDSSVGKPVHS